MPWNGAIVAVCVVAANLWAWHYTDYGVIAAVLGVLGIGIPVLKLFKVELAVLEAVISWRRWPWLVPVTFVAWLVSLLWGTVEVTPTMTLTNRRVDFAQALAPKDVESVVLPDKGSKKVRLWLAGGREYVITVPAWGCASRNLKSLSVTPVLVPDQITMPIVRIVPTPALLNSAKNAERTWRLLVYRNDEEIARIEPYRGAPVTCGCDGTRLLENERIHTVIERSSNGTWLPYSVSTPYFVTTTPGQEMTIDAPH